MCDCCDPTSDSPDPVVQRLERELADAESRNEWHMRQVRKGYDMLVAKDAEIARLNDLLADRGNIISDMSHRLKECQDREEKSRNERDDNAHVIVEAGIIPGCDYHCRCDACRRVVKAMDEAGFICVLETDERWWDESEVKP